MGSPAEALGRALLNNLVQYEEAKKALRGSLDELAKLAAEDAEVALSVRVEDVCAVHVAVRSGSAWALRDLLRVRPELVTDTTSDERRSSAIHYAARSSCDGVFECAELLLDAGADVEAVNLYGSTALHHAADAGKESTLRLLLSRGARTDARAAGRGGITALHDAARKGHVGCIKALVEFGADVSATDTDTRGRTPLQLAALSAPAEAVQALVDAGADVNQQAANSGATALMAAAMTGRADNVAVLLRAGADPGALDRECWNALHWVAEYMDKRDAAACMEMLLCAGVSPAALDVDEETPLDLAVRRGHAAAAAPLLLAFDSTLPSERGLAAVRAALPGAASIAQRQLVALQAPSTLSDAAALLDARLSAAVGSGGSECPFARLRVLRLGALPWQQAWKHMPALQKRYRFSGAVDRLARAQAVLACAEKAEPAAAERSVAVLRQLFEAPSGSREREKLTYAAAVCVAKWADVAQEAVVKARRELAAAQSDVAAARAKGEETLARLRGWLQDGGAAE